VRDTVDDVSSVASDGEQITPAVVLITVGSHQELRAAVAGKAFREDLYYRLARAVVHVPPLRARVIG
jgi:transcriptional regulator with PAS, ATPase and Fis domain